MVVREGLLVKAAARASEGAATVAGRWRRDRLPRARGGASLLALAPEPNPVSLTRGEATGNAVVLLYRISDVPHAADPAPTTAAALDDLLSPAAAEPLPSG